MSKCGGGCILIFIAVGLTFFYFYLAFPSIRVNRSPKLETPEKWINKMRHILVRECNSETKKKKKRKNIDGSYDHCAKKICRKEHEQYCSTYIAFWKRKRLVYGGKSEKRLSGGWRSDRN